LNTFSITSGYFSVIITATVSFFKNIKTIIKNTAKRHKIIPLLGYLSLSIAILYKAINDLLTPQYKFAYTISSNN
jgi:hypothetical protein